ncbi:aspartate/glutamate racemase family protein [Estrella lausannensis]|uniref:Putative aspartate racemase n=1 Tax=Estrella lausannensis TaxID=483423 RepID=A0A0H5DQZ9_9BACT|nr:aspartate/glutamate racemase family protein [Estrella lausannensis]CRX38563.1 Putative aspartate racemase [Estrella lausannensis]
MKPKNIGIVGGAGPMAGVLLTERVLALASSLYQCQRDRDFPQVTLFSFPFSEMLTDTVQEEILKGELTRALDTLKRTGAEVLAIACNTVHAFLSPEMRASIIHMPLMTRERVRGRRAMVLSTSTSVKKNVHGACFPSVYPGKEVQREIDLLIDRVLRREDLDLCKRELKRIVEAVERPDLPLVLGCTELSLIKEGLVGFEGEIIDPLEIVAQEVIEKSFNNKEK